MRLDGRVGAILVAGCINKVEVMSKKPSMDTASWLKQLSNVQLPVLSGVMKDINAVTQNSESCASQLSELILRDASLTSKVLRIANSAYHNPNAENEITTISRAVVQLGFQGIKAISLSVMLVESLLKQDNKTRMLEWMGRGFHTAVQAENLINKVGGEESEEVFITALMMHVGDMAFWSTKGEHAEELNRRLEAGEASNPELEEAILGTTIKSISQGLAEEWCLGPDVEEVLSPGHKPSMRAQAVLLGEKISLAAEKGWDSTEFGDVLVDASLFTGMGLQDIRQMIMDGADKAAVVAVNFGANKVCQYIPSTVEDKKPEPEDVSIQGDPQLQLDVLREMGEMVEKGVGLNTLFQMAVEGIHRGIGFERVSLCLIDPRVTKMEAKYVLGDADHWRDDLKFPVKSEQDNLFAYCLHRRQSVWMRRKHITGLEHLVNKKMQNNIDVDNCVVSGIFAGNRPIGVLLADRGNKGKEITQEQNESFCHFTQQINMSLAMLATKRG